MTFLQCGVHISFSWSVNANEMGSANTPRLNAISDVPDLKKSKKIEIITFLKRALHFSLRQ